MQIRSRILIDHRKQKNRLQFSMKLKDVAYEMVKSEIKQTLNASDKYTGMSSRLNENRKLSQSIRESF